MPPHRRWRTWRYLAGFVLIVAILNVLLANRVRHFNSASTLHTLIPATNTNKYLCQLLISSIILNYPTPVLLNWDAPDRGNTPQRHVAKVNAIKNYLNEFPSSKENDLVLIVDGFDVWFQLPPDVLLRRYFATIDEQNDRLAEQLGSSTIKKHGIRSSILFGADKSCEQSKERDFVGCWAPPQSPMPLYSYGPYDDTSFQDAAKDPLHSRPRWLSPGTIIGPVKDLRLLFEEVSRTMREDTSPASDGWYYSQLFGIQEYSRSRLTNGDAPPSDRTKPPNVSADQMTDFHIALDYTNSMFQPVGNNDQYMTWWIHDGAKEAALPKKGQKKARLFKLPQDLSKARRPFEAMHGLKMSAFNEKYQELIRKAGKPNFKLWVNLPLALNVITHNVIPLMHFTSEKDYRNIWWEKLWFYPFARDLLRSNTASNQGFLYHKKIDKRMWRNSETPITKFIEGSNQERRDGAWNERGEWQSFSSMCSAFDEDLFGTSYDSTVLSYP